MKCRSARGAGPSPGLVVVAVLALWAGGCGTFSGRVVSEPGASVARLQSGGSLAAEVDCRARPLIDAGEIHGMAVGVLLPDDGIRVYGYGAAGAGSDSPPPDGRTIFQIGSVSKVFLTALLAVLVAEGAMDYEDSVRGILPREVPVAVEVGKVTVRELALNLGGLPRQPACLRQLRDFTKFLCTGRNLYAYIDRRYLYQYLRGKRVRGRADRRYVYSNIGYGLLAHLIEVKTGRPIAELMEAKICGPLGMRDTVFVLNEEQQTRLAVGHAGGQPFFMRRGEPLAPWEMGEIMRAAGCLYSTVNDLLIFARANLGRLGHPLEPVLASIQRRELCGPREDVALGWLIDYQGEDRLALTYKQGVVSGYSGYIGLGKEHGIAVVALCNTFSWDEKVGHDLLLGLARALGKNESRRGETDRPAAPWLRIEDCPLGVTGDAVELR